MRRTPLKKAGLVALAATSIVAISVATALAAPILQPGVTSAPGMSGVCTNCHVYAKPPVVTPPVVTPPVVTPPVVTPPVVTPPSAGESHEKDNDEKAQVKKTTKKASHKKHHKKARSHKHND